MEKIVTLLTCESILFYLEAGGRGDDWETSFCTGGCIMQENRWKGLVLFPSRARLAHQRGSLEVMDIRAIWGTCVYPSGL